MTDTFPASEPSSAQHPCPASPSHKAPKKATSSTAPGRDAVCHPVTLPLRSGNWRDPITTHPPSATANQPRWLRILSLSTQYPPRSPKASQLSSFKRHLITSEACPADPVNLRRHSHTASPHYTPPHRCPGKTPLSHLTSHICRNASNRTMPLSSAILAFPTALPWTRAGRYRVPECGCRAGCPLRRLSCVAWYRETRPRLGYAYRPLACCMDAAAKGSPVIHRFPFRDGTQNWPVPPIWPPESWGGRYPEVAVAASLRPVLLSVALTRDLGFWRLAPRPRRSSSADPPGRSASVRTRRGSCWFAPLD